MYGSEAGFAMIIMVFILAYLFWIAILLAGYILKGIALSRMVKNAGLPNSGLAWVPFASTWLLGVLCDRSQQALTGRRWRFDLLLPALELLAVGCGSLLAGPGGFFAECYLYAGFSYSTLRDAIKVFFGFCYLGAIGAGLWHLYQDYAPEQGLLSTILSVILGRVGRGILLMTIRNKVPLSAGGDRTHYQSGTETTGWGQTPYRSGPGTTGWDQPPYQSGPGTTGWDQPPYQSGPGTTGWSQPPYQSGPGTTGWGQTPPKDPPGPEVPPFHRNEPRDEDGPGGGPEL